MLLEKLREYSDRLTEVPPPLYTNSPVRYLIELDEKGHLLSPQPNDTATDNPTEKRGVRHFVPSVARTAGIRPLLLADKAEATFGLARPQSPPGRVSALHTAYLALVEQCAAQTGERDVAAVLRFLQDAPTEKLELPANFDREALITFRVNGRFVVDLVAVQSFWQMVNDPDSDLSKPAPRMQCQVCGEVRPVLKRLQTRLKGVPGGKPSGTTFISANEPAFLSYGLEASLIAPTCAECGERFTRAANALLADRTSRVIVGNAAFIFWTREPMEVSLLDYFDSPQPGRVRNLLNSLKTGQPVTGLDTTPFYAASLSGSGGRAVVRDWHEGTLGEVARKLGRWFSLQRLVGPFGEAPFSQDNRPLGLYALAAATVRDPVRELSAATPRALFHAALTGAPVPFNLLQLAVSRNRAEGEVSRQRAVLIKMVLLSQLEDFREDYMSELETTITDPAYHCGRLLAVLEEAQRQAIEGIKSTLVDRYYGSASSSPASVFGQLMKNVQAHLTKLERDKPGVYNRIQRQLEEIAVALPGFPRTVTLEQQGLFSLGYYQQRAYNRAKAIEGAARKKAQAASAAAAGEQFAVSEQE